MKTALILGVASQDGSYLAEFLLSQKYRVVGTVRPHSSDDESNISLIRNQITIENADLLNNSSLTDLIQKYHPDEFYNLAAMALPAISWDHAYLVGQVTGLGPVASLEAIRQYSPDTRFFQASTREIFGTVKAKSVTENTPIHPENPYAAAKAYAHFMVQNYRHRGIFAANGILFNHESPRRSPDFVTRKITSSVAAIKKGVTKDKLVLANLDSKRDRGFAGDYVEAMWKILQYDKPDDWIIATGELHSIQDICEVAFSSVGLNWHDWVVTDPEAIRVSDTSALSGDYSKAKKLLGWQPKASFKELIEMMVQSDLTRLS